MKKEDIHINIPWDLMISRLKGEVEKENGLSLDEWLKSDVKHQALWEELQLTWVGMKNQNQGFEPDKEYAWKAISREISKNKKSQWQHFVYKYWQAAAACLILATGIFIGSLITVETTRTDLLSSYETQSGKSFLSLPDGSCVWLNANSVLQVPDNFDRTNRKVRLKGEALFDISHDSSNPFIVQLDDVDVKVHGTKFNVKNPDDREDIEITLLNGSVSLSTEGRQEVYLDPGNKATFDRSSQQISISPADVSLISLWARDKLVVDDQPFGTVVEALQVWYGKEIEISPTLKESDYFTLTIRDESLDEILRLMQKTGKFKYEIKDKKVLIY